jgi:hypothetical protein
MWWHTLVQWVKQKFTVKKCADPETHRILATQWPLQGSDSKKEIEVELTRVKLEKPPFKITHFPSDRLH